MLGIDPYGAAAAGYDGLSGERLVYRAGRLAGMRLLGLHRGDAVLDLGCGTGLNLPYLLNAVGASGLVIGVDASPHVLAVARRKVRRFGWDDRVRLLEADAQRLEPSQVLDVVRAVRGPDAVAPDALLATYALSVMPDWRAAWSRATAAVRPSARAAVVDMQRPTGPWRVLTPLALGACALGGADIDAHPWTALQAEGREVRSATLRGGHLRIVAGTLTGPRRGRRARPGAAARSAGTERR